MSTESETAARPDLDDPVLTEADIRAVFAAFVARTPVAPEVAERVQARGTRLREEHFRNHGIMDDATFQALIDEDDDE